MTREHRIQEGNRIDGMCYFSGRLYVVERHNDAGTDRYRLAVYSVTDKDIPTVLDTLDLEVSDVGQSYVYTDHNLQPRVDRHSGQVYIPCGHYGVRVVRYDGRKLVLVTTLRCVKDAFNLAVVSPDTLYTSDWYSSAVYLVDVTQDRVIDRLQTPRWFKHHLPRHITFLGDTVLVYYEGDGRSLVLYRHGDPTPDKRLQRPSQGTWFVDSLATDHHSSLLAVHRSPHNVYVLDVSGNLTHTIPLPGDRYPRDCTVVGEQLWVLCDKGEIIVMSSH